MIALLVSVLVCSPATPRSRPRESANASAAQPAATDDEIRARVETYLGAIDRPTPVARWRALGSRGAALLTGIAQDPQALPTRRAKALAGLTAIAPQGAGDLMVGLASSETAPRVVRLSAIRGAAVVLPASRVVGSLQPVLEGARDEHVRRVAAQALAAHGGCAAVRAQAAREVDARTLQRPLASCAIR